jgi:hypothetical protein
MNMRARRGSEARGFRGALMTFVTGKILVSATDDAPLERGTGEALTEVLVGDAVGLRAMSWRGIASVTDRQRDGQVSRRTSAVERVQLIVTLAQQIEYTKNN